MTFTKVAPAGIGTEPGSTIRLGDSLLHSTGLDVGTGTGVGVTIRQHGDATFSGIVTASAFFGDGSGLEGVSSSGIGTPLSDDDTSDLNKIYYANQELVIDSTVTVNHPDTGIAAYTHYQDLVVKDNADFIVADGDTFIPDVLGINTSSLPNPVSSATGGRIRAGTLTNAGANGAPNFPNGLTGTAGTFTGNLNVGGVLTYEDVTNVDSVGVITARSTVSIADSIVHTGDTNTSFRFPAADTITAETGGIERLRITSDGKIGINNDNPIHAVHIKSVMASSPSYIHMTSTGSNVNGGGGGIAFDTSAANTDETKFLATIAGIRNTEGNGSNDLVFSTTKMGVSGGAPTEKLRIGSSGQFGISGANYGTAGQVLTSQGASSAVQWATPSSGLSYAQQWHLTANGNCSGNTDNVLPTDAGTWEKQSQATNHAGSVGSDMSYSSGVFTFPATGIWKIEFYGYWGIGASDSDHNLVSRIQTTTNGGSSFATTSQSSNSIKSDSTYTYQGFYVTFIFDVTSTSDRKCRFVLNPSGSNCYYKASNNPPQTGATFMRLGDT